MSGYRQHSFDPSAGHAYGRPLRPFNAWQWLGVCFIAAGITALLAAMAGQFGWLPIKAADWIPASTSLCLIGSLFINSRREELSPEATARQRRRGLIAVVIAFAICAITAALVILFKGA